MDNIIKTFKFEAENITLLLYIKKGIQESHPGIKIYIDGEIKSTNKNLEVIKSNEMSSVTTTLKYKIKTIFWISYNPHHGLRWGLKGDLMDKKTGFCVFHTTKEMKDQYIVQRDYIPIIGDCFLEGIKIYKKESLLYETPLSDILNEDD